MGQSNAAVTALVYPSCNISRNFKVQFQSLEKCKLVLLPHPSGSWGLDDDYVKSLL